MALQQAALQVTWDSSANTNALAAGASEDSNTMTARADAVSRAITCKADNSGTPAAGDYVDFYLKASTGDPDGASTNEFPSSGHAIWLCRLDTNTDDPAIETVFLDNTAFREFKIYTVSNAASNSITCSAEMNEQYNA